MPSRPIVFGQKFTTTGTGAVVENLLPVKRFSIQVKGVGAGATSWTADLQGSLDGVNYTTIITHATADLDGVVKFDSADKPVAYIRINLSAVVLGPASALIVTVSGSE